MSTTLANVDQADVLPGAPEELAGPPHVEVAPAPAMVPVAQADRISTLDVLRGFSLMGILVMNICDFAYGGVNYTFPLSTGKPVFSGPHMAVNTVLWFARWIFAEGKMRGLFSMLFGAGVILLLERAEKRGAGLRAADIFTRRNMWLVLFGMLHGYLIWDGDILFYYGVAALMFLLPFRTVRVRRLLWTAAVLLVLNSMGVYGGQYIGMVKSKEAADKANAKLAQHKVLTQDEVDSLKGWSKQQEGWRQSDKKKAEDVSAMQKGYLGVQGHNAGQVFKGEVFGAYLGFGDWAGMMLLGMALYKNGFLPGRLSNRTYATVAAVGLAIAWGVTGLGAYVAWHGHFDQLQSFRWLNFPYDVTRAAGAIGNAALLILIVKAGRSGWLTKPVAAVGQMALSNYLLTSLTMSLVYRWGPWHWFNAVEYYKVYLAVAGMWVFNMVFSTLWLRAFRFGPVEWCWRSLTYWKRQPMRLTVAG